MYVHPLWTRRHPVWSQLANAPSLRPAPPAQRLSSNAQHEAFQYVPLDAFPRRSCSCCLPLGTPVLAKRTYRELKLLKHIQHENIISLSDIFISPLEDIYFVTELLGTDLHRLLTSRPLEKQFIQYFLYQILVSLPPCRRVTWIPDLFVGPRSEG